MPPNQTAPLVNLSSGASVPQPLVAPEEQYLVQTPYGKALLARTRRDGIRELELLDWGTVDNDELNKTTTRRRRRPATLYSSAPFESIEPTVGSDVTCLFGRGKVVEVRKNNATTTVVVVRISSWRLANRSVVMCYLSPASVRVVRPKRPYEMSVYEKVDRAQELKIQAAKEFAAKNYATALTTYAQAVDTLRFAQHDANSNTQVRADLVVLMITCSNNAAMCCSQLQRWTEAEQHARSALALMDALEPKRGEKIHTLLNTEGHADIKLFGEWRVKSCLHLARALAERQSTEEALQVLRQAHEVIAKYTSSNSAGDATAMTTTNNNSEDPSFRASYNNLLSNARQVKKLHVTCKERLKMERKRERLRAQAMFGASSSSAGEEKKEVSDPLQMVKDEDEEAMALGDVSTSAGVNDHHRTNEPTTRSCLSTESNGSQQGSTDGIFVPLGETKKRVSFSDSPPKVKQFKSSDSTNSLMTDGSCSGSGDLVWYQDPELLMGLGVVASGVLLGTAALASYLYSRKR